MPTETEIRAMTDYEILKLAGHSAARAKEIALDAERGDPYAGGWIDGIREGLASAAARDEK